MPLAHDGNNTFVEYDGSPRRFGVASNDDFDYYPTQANYKYSVAFSSPPPPPLQSSSIGVNGHYSSPSPPRPGFPQRIVSFDQPAQQQQQLQLLSKSYSFEDQQILASAFATQQQTTSTLIPTTFINTSSAYEQLPSPPATILPQEKAPHSTIEEEPELIVDALSLHEQDDEMYNDNEDEYDDEVEGDEYYDEEDEAIQEQLNVSTMSVMMPEICSEQEKPPSEAMISSTASAFDITSPTENLPTSTFDYLYEFSETRKVLEEFFKCPDDKIKEFEKFSDFNESDDSLVSLLYHLLISSRDMHNAIHNGNHVKSLLIFLSLALSVRSSSNAIILHSISFLSRFFHFIQSVSRTSKLP